MSAAKHGVVVPLHPEREAPEEADADLELIKPVAFEVQLGGDQNGVVGKALDPFIVKLLNGEGQPCIFEAVEFVLVEGQGEFAHADDQTGHGGEAVAEFVPSAPGRYRIECVAAAKRSLRARFVGIVEAEEEAAAASAERPSTIVPVASPPANDGPTVRAPDATVAPTLAPAPLPSMPARPTAAVAPPRIAPPTVPPPASAIGRVPLKRVAVARPPIQAAIEVQAAAPVVRTVPMPAAARVPPRTPAAPRPAQPQVTARSLLTGRRFVIIGLTVLALAFFGTTAVAVNALTAPEPPPSSYDCSNAQGTVVNGTIVYRNCPAVSR